MARPVGLVRWVWVVGVVAYGLSGLKVRAGIPEPDLVWYGRVMATVGGVPVRLTAGNLEWRLEPVGGGAAVVISTSLSSINDQFSYVLRVPCESSEPGVLGTSGVVVLGSPPSTYRRVTVTLDGVPLSLQGASGEFAPGWADRGKVERMDLVLGVELEDSDGNGLPDAWEILYFGGVGVDPDGDADGDGMTNRKEFLAGTDPRDAQSLFEFLEIAVTPGGVVIEWSSQAGRRYRVRRASSLAGDAAGYSTLQGGIQATAPRNQYLDSNAGAGAGYFYRVELEE